MHTRIYGAFGVVLRQGLLSRKNQESLAGGTVEETLAKLEQIFRSNVGFNPTMAQMDMASIPY
jgi:hypothetical protein